MGRVASVPPVHGGSVMALSDPRGPRVSSRLGRPPAKGTARRQFLLMALRPQGVTSWETSQFMTPSVFHGHLTALREEKGYDIRAFPIPRERRTAERVGTNGVTCRKPPVIYRLVGKRRWNGTYRDFVAGRK